jgi:response regulator RpfG family c-di-GMP phosphodiesterase
MTTALDDPKNVVEAYYKGGATSYVPKTIDRQLFCNCCATSASSSSVAA